MFKTNIECYVFTDSQYLNDAILGICSEAKQEYFSYLSTGEMPFNNYGGMKNNVNYNYTGYNLAGHIGSGNALWIKDTIITDFNRRGFFVESQNLSNDVYFGIVEFEVNKPRLT